LSSSSSVGISAPDAAAAAGSDRRALGQTDTRAPEEKECSGAAAGQGEDDQEEQEEALQAQQQAARSHCFDLRGAC